LSSLKRFQSHNGAIAARNFSRRTPLIEFVSIPQWCDCCAILRNIENLKMLVSIPQWCDCCGEEDNEGNGNDSSFNPTMVRLLPSTVGGSWSP